MFQRKLTLLFLVCCIQVMAVPVLERTVTMKWSKTKMETVLQAMEQQAQFSFSYNAALVNTQEMVNIQVSNKTVRETLYQLFHNKITFKAKGNYVLLYPGEVKAETLKPNNEPIVIWGYVSDSSTKQKIAYATVYEKKSLKSTLTNEYGYFTMVLNPTKDSLELLIQKETFQNVSINTKPTPDLVLNIVMVKPMNEVEEIVVANSSPIFDSQAAPKPIEEQAPMITTPTLSKRLDQAYAWLTPFRSKFMLLNVNDSFDRDFQMSFVPFFGTNGMMSGSINNKISINIIGGYNGGLSAFEAGGVFNIIRNDMHGVQAAGIFNAVGRNSKGLQAAGIFNSNFGTTEGLQAAGIFNNNIGNVSGMQLAGIFNSNIKETNAFQAAGILNNSVGNFTGFQAAGIGNSCFKNVKGSQVAGIYNLSVGKTQGSQLAGILNVSGGNMKGLQVAGILNIAKNIHGMQIGLINISDTCEGIPIGYLSIVKSGYHQIELSTTETGLINASFRTGVSKFHNIISIGLPAGLANKGVWSYSYGLGTSKSFNVKNTLDIDLGYTKLNKGRNISAPNNIYTLYVGINRQFAKHSSLSYGLTLNDYMLDPLNVDFETFKDFAPYTLFKSLGKFQHQMWVGAKVGIRLF